jgi:hypothetical protein
MDRSKRQSPTEALPAQQGNRPASDYHAATEAAAAAVATCGRFFFYFDFLIIILEINPVKYFLKKI